jgi:hypothetical protein
MSASIPMNQTDFLNMGVRPPKIVEEEIIDPIMKRGTKANFNRTGDVSHTDTKPKPIPEETETSNENPAQQQQMALKSAFAPRNATPAVTLFSPLPAITREGGFKLDSGRKTQDFVPLVARSNANYLKWVNRFNAIPQGSIPQ